MKRLENFLAQWARWPVIAGLAALSIFFMAVLFPLATPKVTGEMQTPLDTRLWYTASQVQTYLSALTPAQRNLSAWSHLTLDGVYPLVYGGLFALLLMRVWPESGCWKLALAAIGADYLENILMAILLWTHPRYLLALAPLAAVCTALKWLLLAVALVLMVWGGLYRWKTSRAG